MCTSASTLSFYRNEKLDALVVHIIVMVVVVVVPIAKKKKTRHEYVPSTQIDRSTPLVTSDKYSNTLFFYHYVVILRGWLLQYRLYVYMYIILFKKVTYAFSTIDRNYKLKFKT